MIDICKHCSSKNIKETERLFADNTKHIELKCADCDKFLQWKNYVPLEEKRFFFGKYRGKKFIDVAMNDLNYCEWVAKNGMIKGINLILLLEAIEIAKLNESRK